MKLGKLKIGKKKLIIGGSVILVALVTAGVVFACNVNKTSEVKTEDIPAIQTQETAVEENKEQTQTEAQNDENKSEVKDNNVKNNKDKKENAKENKTAKNNSQKPVMPEVKTDLKINGDQVVLNANGKDGSSKTILTFNGDKLTKLVVEIESSNEAMLKETKEFYEKGGFKILESNGKVLKVEMSQELVDALNQSGSKQEIIDFYKQLSEALKG